MNIDTALNLRATVLHEYEEVIKEMDELYHSITEKAAKLPQSVDLKLYELAYDLMPLLEQELEGTEEEYKIGWEQFHLFAVAEYEYFEDWLTDCPNAKLEPIGRTSSYTFSSPQWDVEEIFEAITEGYYDGLYDFLSTEVSILFETDTLKKVIENYDLIEEVLIYDELEYIVDLEKDFDEVHRLLKETHRFIDDALTINRYIELFKKSACENFLHYQELEDYLYLVDEIRQKKVA